MADGSEGVAADPSIARTTSPLALPSTPLLHIATGAHPDGVVLAAGPATADGGARIGVAWQEGCEGAAGAVVKLAIVDWHPAGMSMVSPPIKLSTGLSAAWRPSIVYVPDGFLRVGTKRGTTTVTDANDGGWLVAFVGKHAGAEHGYVTRISELDGTALEAPVDTEPTAMGATVQSIGVYPFTGTARAAFASVDTGRAQIRGGELLCSPSAGMSGGASGP